MLGSHRRCLNLYSIVSASRSPPDHCSDNMVAVISFSFEHRQKSMSMSMICLLGSHLTTCGDPGILFGRRRLGTIWPHLAHTFCVPEQAKRHHTRNPPLIWAFSEHRNLKKACPEVRPISVFENVSTKCSRSVLF